MLFKLSNLNSNLALTLGSLNPALNNSAQDSNIFHDALLTYSNEGAVRTYEHILLLNVLATSEIEYDLNTKKKTSLIKHFM